MVASRSVLPLLCLAFGASLARGQSFNIDIDQQGSIGAGRPEPSYGAAADQKGHWKIVPATGEGPFWLPNTDGEPTGMVMTREGPGPVSGAGVDVLAFISTEARLIEDAQKIEGSGAYNYTFTGLRPGRYLVYTYAVAVDEGSRGTAVEVAGSAPPSRQVVSGVPQYQGYLSTGFTHSRHWVQAHDGTIRISVSATSESAVVSGFQIKSAPERFYVTKDAAPGGDGLSWETAFDDYDPAFDAADRHEGLPTEVWFGEGVYSISTRTPIASHLPASLLPNGVRIYGGFRGNEAEPYQRRIHDHPTVFDGEQGDPDDPYDNLGSTFLIAPLEEATLDGLTIRNVFGSHHSAVGAGVRIIELGVARIWNCTFENLTVGASLEDPCAGSADSRGAAIFARVGSIVDIRDCDFINNTACSGGAVYLESDEVTLQRCRFIGNTAGRFGGALVMYSPSTFFADPGLDNCLFSGNRVLAASQAFGGAAIGFDGVVNVENCTFYANDGPPGAGVFKYTPGIFGTRPSHVALVNCIVWGNPIFAFQCAASAVYSNIEGGFSSIGNISEDPMFVDPYGADGEPGTVDDDLRLRACSPCVDAGKYPELGYADLEGFPRVVDLVGVPNVTEVPTDMGAYEAQPGPAMPGDANADARVDFFDVTEVLGGWGLVSYYGWIPGDANGDLVVDKADLIEVLTNWGASCE